MGTRSETSFNVTGMPVNAWIERNPEWNEFFWLKWFQKIIGGSYIIAFHSEITAGSDKNKDAVIGLSSDPATQLPYLSSRPYKYPGTGSENFSGLIIFKKFFCAGKNDRFLPGSVFSQNRKQRYSSGLLHPLRCHQYCNIQNNITSGL